MSESRSRSTFSLIKGFSYCTPRPRSRKEPRCVEPGRFANLPAKDEHVANNAPVIKTHKKPLARSKIRRWVLKPPRRAGELGVMTPEDEGL
ncbi:hypothetical protein KOW79_017165 [Hemibagrus wyckioides]|uniref:Uncharacterized protein n=1 Tax=Hemibagrus wyckioides TaxID=337641 RepID=A0A9D3ND67_9TELE|nr:hypothetical protein KOW79_017165 [Hemibagrus wyckioides]